MNTLGVLGGSGVYQIEGLTVKAEHEVETPFGRPSSKIVEAVLEYSDPQNGRSQSRLLFLARHGQSHEIPPHQINYRANICAMKMLGVEQLVSVSAVGSMREEIAPGDVVIVDQYIDWTKSRKSTFFEDGIVAHVSLADPVCKNLHQAAVQAVEAACLRNQSPRRVHRAGTYLCMEGPQFSTRAESHMYRSWGVNVIGMTAATEAKLAREAQLPYVTIAMATDYDCWHESEEDVSVESVLAVLRANASLSQLIIQALPQYLPDPSPSAAASALNYAIISQGPRSEAIKERLSWLLGDALPS